MKELEGRNLLFGTETCGRCHVIEEKMRDKNIPFLKITDYEILLDYRITSVPVVITAEGIRMSSPREINDWIKEWGN